MRKCKAPNFNFQPEAQWYAALEYLGYNEDDAFNKNIQPWDQFSAVKMPDRGKADKMVL